MLKPKWVENAKLLLFWIHLNSLQSLSGRTVALVRCEAATICREEHPSEWQLLYLSYFVWPETPVMSKAFLCQAVQTWRKRRAHRTCLGADWVVGHTALVGTWILGQEKKTHDGNSGKREVHVPTDALLHFPDRAEGELKVRWAALLARQLLEDCTQVSAADPWLNVGWVNILFTVCILEMRFGVMFNSI